MLTTAPLRRPPENLLPYTLNIINSKQEEKMETSVWCTWKQDSHTDIICINSDFCASYGSIMFV